MAVTPSTTPNLDKYTVYTATTAGAVLSNRVPVRLIRWCLTTAPTSTWTLQISESTAVHGTTEVRTLLGPIVAGSTAGVPQPYLDFPINGWVNSIYIDTISGGTVQVITAPRNGTGYIF